ADPAPSGDEGPAQVFVSAPVGPRNAWDGLRSEPFDLLVPHPDIVRVGRFLGRTVGDHRYPYPGGGTALGVVEKVSTGVLERFAEVEIVATRFLGGLGIEAVLALATLGGGQLGRVEPTLPVGLVGLARSEPLTRFRPFELSGSLHHRGRVEILAVTDDARIVVGDLRSRLGGRLS